MYRRQRLKMLIDLEGAHVFYLNIFGGVEHLRASVRKEPASGHSTSRFNVTQVPIADAATT
jgi:hypothetical protein